MAAARASTFGDDFGAWLGTAGYAEADVEDIVAQKLHGSRRDPSCENWAEMEDVCSRLDGAPQAERLQITLIDIIECDDDGGKDVVYKIAETRSLASSTSTGHGTTEASDFDGPEIRRSHADAAPRREDHEVDESNEFGDDEECFSSVASGRYGGGKLARAAFSISSSSSSSATGWTGGADSSTRSSTSSWSVRSRAGGVADESNLSPQRARRHAVSRAEEPARSRFSSPAPQVHVGRRWAAVSSGARAPAIEDEDLPGSCGASPILRPHRSILRTFTPEASSQSSLASRVVARVERVISKASSGTFPLLSPTINSNSSSPLNASPIAASPRSPQPATASIASSKSRSAGTAGRNQISIKSTGTNPGSQYKDQLLNAMSRLDTMGATVTHVDLVPDESGEGIGSILLSCDCLSVGREARAGAGDPAEATVSAVVTAAAAALQADGDVRSRRGGKATRHRHLPSGVHKTGSVNETTEPAWTAHEIALCY